MAESSLPHRVLATLDVAAFERIEPHQFVCRAPAPTWLEALLPVHDSNETIALADHFLFLHSFLERAGALWEKDSPDPDDAHTTFGLSALRSESWVEHDDEGNEHLLEATALRNGQQAFLLLHPAFIDPAEHRAVLQKGRSLNLALQQVHYLSLALDQVDELVSIIKGNPDGVSEMKITWVNQAYVATAEEEKEEDLLGTTPWIFEDLDEDSEMAGELHHALQTGSPLRGETAGRKEEGEPYFISWLLTPVRDDEDQITHWVSVQRDVTERRVREKQLEHEATHDPLTGLLNRSAFEKQVHQALNTEGEAGALLYLDLDRFKSINDTYGHSAGDQLLNAISRTLKDTFRDRDAVGRIGGDEFVAWVSPPVDREGTDRMVEQLTTAFEEPIDIQGEQMPVEFSMGLVQDITPYETAELALEAADIAMYKAKQSSGRTIVTNDESAGTGESSHNRLTPLILEAARDGGFETFLQPIVQLKDGSLAGFEVLARWRRQNGTLASPSDFLEVAEEKGLIVPIGRQVLEGGCKALRELRDGTPTDLAVTLSGNFTREEFFQDDTYEFIEQLLETYEIPAGNFTMEVTERVTEDRSQNGTVPADKLKSLGVNVEIDDFGTGYSSLRSLLRFPADGLKLDKGLTAEITSGERGFHIARSGIEMARSLDLYVTAEGIETPEQLSVLRDLGCQYGQGYLFSEPVPGKEAEALLNMFPQDLSAT